MNRVSSFDAAASYAIALLVFAAPLCAQLVGQNTGPESGAASGTAGIAEITGTRTPWGTSATTNKDGRIYDQSRSVFLRGNVMFDDGTPPGSSVGIERVCGSNVRIEAHADSKGRFSFRLGGEAASNIADADSSSNSLGTAHSAGDGLGESGGAGSAGLLHCQLRAVYPGYASESVDLTINRSHDNQEVGTILLHRLANVRGTTLSLTTALAPKSAKKSVAKGYQFSQRGRFAEAEQQFKSATLEDPQFAVAWFALGQVQYRMNKPQDAAKSYLDAVAADSRYVSPYNQLALLCGEQGKWQDAAQYSKQAIELNPVELPSSFWYNALANYNLKNDAEAEKSAQALVKLDSQHRFPQAETMLAEFAGNRGDWQEAATHLRAFLSQAPAATNAGEVKQQLAHIEAERAIQAKFTPAVPH
jgi:tetratricopeptide (TPR) repeat protein